jgi:hypothetical protein
MSITSDDVFGFTTAMNVEPIFLMDNEVALMALPRTPTTRISTEILEWNPTS